MFEYENDRPNISLKNCGVMIAQSDRFFTVGTDEINIRFASDFFLTVLFIYTNGFGK